MTAYATIGDLESRWRSLSNSDEARAEALLDDAAVWLRTWAPDLDSRIADGSLDESVPVMISCAMVKRAMLDSDGMSSETSQQAAGVYSQSMTRAFANPQGNLYLTGQEKDMLLGFPPDAVSMTMPGM